MRRRFTLLMDRLRGLYDVIIIKSPPVLPNPAAFAFCDKVDIAILTLLHGHSRNPLVARAKHMLTAHGAPSVGVVLCEYDSDDFG